MRNGDVVAAFEREFASYAGAEHAIAVTSGTAALHTALQAMGVGADHRVLVPPLTMSATTIAVLQTLANPVFQDVDPDTWTMVPLGAPPPPKAAYHVDMRALPDSRMWALPVALYGLPCGWVGDHVLIDAAQCAVHVHGAVTQDGAKHDSRTVAYSFQASKILPTGEGGMVVTDDPGLAQRARSFSSLGYEMGTGPKIDTMHLRHPRAIRHPMASRPIPWNYRMNDATAGLGLAALEIADELRATRAYAADCYRQAIEGCSWLIPQKTPEGWARDWWCYGVAIARPAFSLSGWELLADEIQKNGGERPYAAWRLTYHEPMFRWLAAEASCPVAEDLQPRLLQFQTNSREAGERNAAALARAIQTLGGAR